MRNIFSITLLVLSLLPTSARAADLTLEGGFGHLSMSNTFTTYMSVMGSPSALVDVGKTSGTEFGFRIGVNTNPFPFVDIAGELNLFFAMVPLGDDFQDLLDTAAEGFDVFANNYLARAYLGPRVSGNIPMVPVKPWVSFGLGYGGYWTTIKTIADDDSAGSKGFSWDIGVGVDYTGLPILRAGIAFHHSSISITNDSDYSPGTKLGANSLHLRVGANF